MRADRYAVTPNLPAFPPASKSPVPSRRRAKALRPAEGDGRRPLSAAWGNQGASIARRAPRHLRNATPKAPPPDAHW